MWHDPGTHWISRTAMGSYAHLFNVVQACPSEWDRRTEQRALVDYTSFHCTCPDTSRSTDGEYWWKLRDNFRKKIQILIYLNDTLTFPWLWVQTWGCDWRPRKCSRSVARFPGKPVGTGSKLLLEGLVRVVPSSAWGADWYHRRRTSSCRDEFRNGEETEISW